MVGPLVCSNALGWAYGDAKCWTQLAIRMESQQKPFSNLSVSMPAEVSNFSSCTKEVRSASSMWSLTLFFFVQTTSAKLQEKSRETNLPPRALPCFGGQKPCTFWGAAASSCFSDSSQCSFKTCSTPVVIIRPIQSQLPTLTQGGLFSLLS